MDGFFPFVDVRFTDFIDVLPVATLLALGISWLRRTRARLALLGRDIIGAVWAGRPALPSDATIRRS